MKQNIFKNIVSVAMIFSAFILILSPLNKVMAIEADDYWGGTTQRQYVDTKSGLTGGSESRDPRLVVVDIIKLALGFLGIIATVIILFAGFKWMTSGGNEESVTSAKKMLVAGLIGLVIILCSYALATFILSNLVKAIAGE